MKSSVNPRRRARVLSLLLFLALPVSLRAETSCQCEDPPGGRITCEDGQIPLCKIVNGKVDGKCKTTPKDSSEGLALRAWLLSELLGKQIRPEDVSRSKELQQVLAAGRYVNRQTGEIITFTLPKNR